MQVAQRIILQGVEPMRKTNVLSQPQFSPGQSIATVPGVVAALNLGYQPIAKAITEFHYNGQTIGITPNQNPSATYVSRIIVSKKVTPTLSPVRGNGGGATPNAVATQTLYTAYPGMPTTGRIKQGV